MNDSIVDVVLDRNRGGVQVHSREARRAVLRPLWLRERMPAAEQFDPDYPSDSLDSFAPLVHEVFTREPWAARPLRPGVRVPPVNLAAEQSPPREQRRP